MNEEWNYEPHDDEHYAGRDDDDDLDCWDYSDMNPKEPVPETDEEREERIKAQKERVCQNCENFGQHCRLSFCNRIWQYGAPMNLMTTDIVETEQSRKQFPSRARNCEFYKNKW